MRSSVVLVLPIRSVMVARLAGEREGERLRQLDRLLDRPQARVRSDRAAWRPSRRRSRWRSTPRAPCATVPAGDRRTAASWPRAPRAAETRSISWTRLVRSGPAVGGNVTRTGSPLMRNGPVDPGTNDNVWNATSGCSSTKPSMTASTSGSGMPRSGVANMKLRDVGSELHTHRHQFGEEVGGDLGGCPFVVAIGREEVVDRIDDAQRRARRPRTAPRRSATSDPSGPCGWRCSGCSRTRGRDRTGPRRAARRDPATSTHRSR